MISSLVSRWNEFFHSRIILSTTTATSNTKHHGSSSSSFRWISYLRIMYGLCILYDRIILSLDFNMFFLYSSTSTTTTTSTDVVLPLIPCQQYLLPVSVTMTHSIVDSDLPYSPLCTIAASFPISYYSYIFYLFHFVSIINAILLIVNVYPKVQLILLHINMISLHFHNLLLWDGEDVMFKIWNFLFLFLPLQLQLPLQFPTASSSVSKTKNKKDDDTDSDTNTSSSSLSSYPMWPIRLFQIELCCIYAGAGYAKLSTDIWRSGNALYHVRIKVNMLGVFGCCFIVVVVVVADYTIQY